MSKASEWAKAAPKGISKPLWCAFVSDEGGCALKSTVLRAGFALSQEDALELARWILDTFEDA